MTEYTSTPWRVEGPMALRVVADDSKGTMPIADIRGWGHLTGKGDGALGLSDIEGVRVQEANAAFIVKAVNNHFALLEFFKWAMREGPWDGGELDGASVQDKAESLGLIVKTQYDAEKHGVQSDFETGDDWFEYKPDLRASPVGKPAHD